MLFQHTRIRRYQRSRLHRKTLTTWRMSHISSTNSALHPNILKSQMQRWLYSWSDRQKLTWRRECSRISSGQCKRSRQSINFLREPWVLLFVSNEWSGQQRNSKPASSSLLSKLPQNGGIYRSVSLQPILCWSVLFVPSLIASCFSLSLMCQRLNRLVPLCNFIWSIIFKAVK